MVRALRVLTARALWSSAEGLTAAALGLWIVEGAQRDGALGGESASGLCAQAIQNTECITKDTIQGLTKEGI